MLTIDGTTSAYRCSVRWSFDSIIKSATIHYSEPQQLRRGDLCTLVDAKTSTVILNGIVIAKNTEYDESSFDQSYYITTSTEVLKRSSSQHKGGRWANADLATIVRQICEPLSVGVLSQIQPINVDLFRIKTSDGELASDSIARLCKAHGVYLGCTNDGQLKLFDIIDTPAGQIIAPEDVVNGSVTETEEDVSSSVNMISGYNQEQKDALVDVSNSPINIVHGPKSSKKALKDALKQELQNQASRSIVANYILRGVRDYNPGHVLLVGDRIAGINDKFRIEGVNIDCDEEKELTTVDLSLIR